MHKPTGRLLEYNNEVSQQHRYPGTVISHKYQDIMGQQNLHKGSGKSPTLGDPYLPLLLPSVPELPQRDSLLTEASKHISFSIRQGLPLFQRDQPGNFFLERKHTNRNQHKDVPPFSSQAARKEEKSRRSCWREKAMIYVSLDCTVRDGSKQGLYESDKQHLNNTLGNYTIQLSYQVFFNELLIAEQDLLTA